MGQAAAAASLASTMAQATAAASAWAPAAMSASIATYGSAAAIGQAAYAESMVAAKGLALAGGRRYGGTVSAGNAYRINEDGRSEIFQTAGGQQAFIPNQSGRLFRQIRLGVVAELLIKLSISPSTLPAALTMPQWLKWRR